jgi:hypothetical protein
MKLVVVFENGKRREPNTVGTLGGTAADFWWTASGAGFARP